MRTTLKRGMGRAASANGNGRGVLPPAVLTPMTRYRQPLPRRPTGIRLAGRIVSWLLAALLMLGAAVAGGAYLFFHESVDSLRIADTPQNRRIKERLDQVPAPDKAAVALLIGYDKRAGEAKTDPSRSDTIMLLRADPDLKAVSMLSFPRDLVVDIRCPGRATYQDKINAAYAQCGALGTLTTVKSLIAPIPVNYLITVNFKGFQEIVDQLGGVWIDIDHRYLNTNDGETYNTFEEINLWPGYQRLKGWRALQYVRFRHTDSDFLRVIRQQQFVTAMRQQVRSSFGLTSIPKVIGSITDNVEVGVGGGGELSGGTVLSYALFLYGLPSGHFFQSKIQGIEGYSALSTDPANIERAVREFASPDVEAPKTATDVLRGRKARVPKPEETSVVVLNGNGVEGSAALASSLLADKGYRIYHPPSDLPANAPRYDYSDSVVYYNHGYKRARSAAVLMQKLFAPAKVQKLTPRIARLSNAATLVVALGTTFHGRLTQIATPKPPERHPPDVTPAPEVSLPLVRAARRKLEFPLELPTVLESSSIPDPEVASRVYWLDAKHKKHRTLRLTYRTGAREYWGIQMADWDDAPLLSERNTRQFIKGRTYDLYYSGAHLHMVVLREHKAAYWVVNTLNDSLTNETLLAIAQGLKPLPGPVGRG